MIPFDEAFEKALSMRKYDVLTGRAPNIRRVLSDVLNWIYNNIISPILSRIRFNPPSGFTNANADILKNIFIALAAAAVITAFFFVFMRLRKRARRDKTMREILADLKSGVTSYDRLISDAERLAENRRYREAVRLQYIAMLWVLNKKNIIYLTDYKTNTGIKRELARNAAHLCPRFEHVLGVFNKGWFGHSALSEDVYNNTKRITFELINEAEKSIDAGVAQ